MSYRFSTLAMKFSLNIIDITMFKCIKRMSSYGFPCVTQVRLKNKRHGFFNIHHLEQLKKLIIKKLELLECELFQYSSTFPLYSISQIQWCFQYLFHVWKQLILGYEK